jgi:hypothetical protein
VCVYIYRVRSSGMELGDGAVGGGDEVLLWMVVRRRGGVRVFMCMYF